jgi:diaminohydroxyphosphoribosylaminopyrimidine deaminase/5-amino-6-(5-phosphoribosylamino)uracil reductase
MLMQDFSALDLAISRRALELAARGVGLVSPNPLVGCVIVSAEGEVVGEGTYIYQDTIHAEAIALAQAGERARGGTAYVSLEPHAHHGKTPPCAEALVTAGIKRVVAPIKDPNPMVSGKGFARLREAGIEVVTGILATEAARQNEKFICWHQKSRPFVHLKMALSLDGRISLGRSVSTALTGEEALRRVHELRHEHDAILVGANTAVVDNPSLTDRSGKARRRKLKRVILDNSPRLAPDSTLVETARDFPTLIFTRAGDREKTKALADKGVEVVTLENGARDLQSVLAELKKSSSQSVLVEGGGEVAASFISAGLVDKVTFFYAPIIVGGAEAPSAVGGSGAKKLAETMRLGNIQTQIHGADVELTGYPK